MTDADTVTHRCANCEAPVEVALVDVSTLGDLWAGRRIYRWGLAQGAGCASCGSREYPRLVIDDTNILTQPCERPRVKQMDGWSE